MNLKLSYKKSEKCDIIFDASIFLKKNILKVLKPIVKNNPTFVFIDKNVYQKINHQKDWFILKKKTK